MSDDLDDDDVIYRLEAGLPPRSPEEAAAREPYERLIARIGDLELIEPLSDWEDRAVARWRAARRARRARMALGVTVAVAVAVAIAAMR